MWLAFSKQKHTFFFIFGSVSGELPVMSLQKFFSKSKTTIKVAAAAGNLNSMEEEEVVNALENISKPSPQGQDTTAKKRKAKG